MLWLYAAFVALILGLLALDLGVINRRPHVIGVREALAWSAFWIGLGLVFSLVIYAGYHHQWLGLGTGVDQMSTPRAGPGGALVYNDGGSALIKYLTGFVVEKSLAVDNIFVIAMIFASFAVPPVYQHRVLFWGVLGALLMRGVMIAIGAALVSQFSWVLYLFGGFLILTGVKLLLVRESEPDPARHPVVRWTRRFLPVTERYHGAHFLVRAGSTASREAPTSGEVAEPDRVVEAARTGALLATPLLLALLLIELADVVFAVDSIPAIFAITTDPFLVFTSNVFAMLGLRSLYFALAGIIGRFHYLKPALALVLVVIGAKMLAHSWLVAWLGDHFNLVMLAVVLSILATGVVASMLTRPKELV